MTDFVRKPDFLLLTYCGDENHVPIVINCILYIVMMYIFIFVSIFL